MTMSAAAQSHEQPERVSMLPMRQLADQAFSRAAGAPLIEGNRVRLLKDARENYPAWLEAIGAAKHYIHFENYIIYEDDTGREFADALIAKAREGVRVRLLYDWMGSFGKTSRRFWNRLRADGVEVRCYNPPRLDSPLGWLSRDHRKMVSVDGQVGFVTGLCVGWMWAGVLEKKIEPWRDTGVEVRGPSVADIEQAFAEVWAMIGEPIPKRELASRDALADEGDTALRVVASAPATAGMLRLDQLVAALARKRLWLTDAYYAGTTAYVQALRAAAKDGVDIRLLVPNGTDIPILRPLSRAGYRPLNVSPKIWRMRRRSFWMRSTKYARRMSRAMNPVLTSGGGRAAAGAIRIGNTVGAAFTNRRVLEPAEACIMVAVGVLLLTLAILFAFFPRLLAYPLTAAFVWIAVALLYRGYKLHRRKDQRETGALQPSGSSSSRAEESTRVVESKRD